MAMTCDPSHKRLCCAECAAAVEAERDNAIKAIPRPNQCLLCRRVPDEPRRMAMYDVVWCEPCLREAVAESGAVESLAAERDRLRSLLPALDALLVVWHTPITDTDAEVAGLVLSVEAVLVAYRKLVAVTP